MKYYLSVVVLLTFASVASGSAILTVGYPSDGETVGNLVEVDVTIFGLPTTLDSYQFAVDFTPSVLADVTQIGTIDNVRRNCHDRAKQCWPEFWRNTGAPLLQCNWARNRFSVYPYVECDLARCERKSDSIYGGGWTCLCG